MRYYVKASDLAFAVTEWAIGDDADGRRQTCIVGRVLSMSKRLGREIDD